MTVKLSVPMEIYFIVTHQGFQLRLYFSRWFFFCIFCKICPSLHKP